MHNEEASGSDDDMEEDPLAEAIIAAEVDPDVRNELRAAVNPAAKREADIMAEVARRRAQQGADETKRKSDEIFDHFDQDRDGYLNFPELRALGLATGGELVKSAYDAVCQEIGANPAKGITKPLLLTMYTDAGLGDAHRDYNLIFRR